MVRCSHLPPSQVSMLTVQMQCPPLHTLRRYLPRPPWHIPPSSCAVALNWAASTLFLTRTPYVQSLYSALIVDTPPLLVHGLDSRTTTIQPPPFPRQQTHPLLCKSSTSSSRRWNRPLRALTNRRPRSLRQRTPPSLPRRRR